jgi:predicted DNA-binding protein with PD1-like motif
MPEWPLLPGDKVERKQLHDQFGGRQRVGLGHHAPAQTCCSQIPPLASKHGYVDDWQEDGCFHYTGDGSDRKPKTFALVFDTGEEVVAGLLQFAKDPKLSGAHLTAIGAFERITLGFFDVTKKDYKRIAIQERVELMSLVGNIAQDDKGDPKLHAHVVVGKSDGTAHGGHLLDAQVRPTLEVVVVGASQHLRRSMRRRIRSCPAGSVVIAGFHNCAHCFLT